MARQIRIECAGAAYHVMARGNRYHVVLETPEANLVTGMLHNQILACWLRE
jgi:hypothetical protein